MEQVSAAGAIGRYVTYAAMIGFPDTDLKRVELIRVIGCPLPLQQMWSCLIGRDLMRRWFFSYDGKTGNCTIRE